MEQQQQQQQQQPQQQAQQQQQQQQHQQLQQQQRQESVGMPLGFFKALSSCRYLIVNRYINIYIEREREIDGGYPFCDILGWSRCKTIVL